MMMRGHPTPNLDPLDFLRLTKPSITLAAVMVAGCAIALASKTADRALIGPALVGTALSVASANALNMVLEREGDALMERTKNRPLAAGRMAVVPAVVFGSALGLAGVVALGAFCNVLAALLALVALVGYVCVYTPLKRRTPHALLVGAVPGAMPALIGAAAMDNAIEMPALVLFSIVFLWQVPHFLAIGVRRRVDYERAGIKALPVLCGEHAARLQSVIYCSVLLPTSLMLVVLGVAGALYFIVAAALGLWLLVESSRTVSPSPGQRPWAVGLFGASLLYLPALSTALILDRLVV